MAVAPALADAFVIEGSRRLSGTIRVAGNKNGALPIIASCLLADGPVALSNVPRIRDVDTMLDLLVDLGADASWTGLNEVSVDARGASKSSPDEGLCSKIRASFLLAGPLLARFGRASMPPPGGDVIGRRRIDPHLHAFNELGAVMDLTGRLYELKAPNLRGASVFLDEASVMATENTIMAAVLAKGQTVLGNAACEPHVQDLCRFLVSLGAQIDGIESNVLRITGVESLTGGSWSVGPDHIEVGSFIGMAAITGGDITIEGVRRQDLVSIIPAFGKLGVRVEVGDDTVHVPTKQQLIVEDDLGGMVPKIEDGPWPAFPSDLTSIALTVATQAFGTVLMFEKMFENRLFFTDKLVSMGARIILCDPHRAVITGPARLVGQRMESPDIRAGMAMLLAALSAEGQSTIGAAHQIDKGYERIDERLRALGAAIERVDS
ncbi:MAG: UDP-N-acetylglucosamine 1-carboxyvinyltransferase [Actinomycetota bacterium]|nr:UDP-N-acetylglucosamine 1-carboxyvinyltransferase [Actinomycetota bacterium]